MEQFVRSEFPAQGLDLSPQGQIRRERSKEVPAVEGGARLRRMTVGRDIDNPAVPRGRQQLGQEPVVRGQHNPVLFLQAEDAAVRANTRVHHRKAEASPGKVGPGGRQEKTGLPNLLRLDLVGDIQEGAGRHPLQKGPFHLGQIRVSVAKIG